MKTGDVVQARPAGGRWVECQVDMASDNGKSLALSADEGLPLIAIDRNTCRQRLLLLGNDDGTYSELFTGALYEVREDNGHGEKESRV